MNRFLKLTTIYASSACMLAGCGGGSESLVITESASQISLDGNWFAERRDASGIVYAGERLIRENGTSVLVTYCDRSSESLTRAGNQLFDREGKLHYLYIQDPTTLASRPESSLNSIVRKRSAVGRFDSGSVGLTLPSGETLTTNTDVCAETRTGRYEDSLGNWLSPSIITISIPYRDSYILFTAAFRQIADGQYNVTAFEAFVQGGVNDINMNVVSPSFAVQYGGEDLSITFGTLQVSNYTTSGVTLFANLKTVAGVSVRFTANLKLQPRS